MNEPHIDMLETIIVSLTDFRRESKKYLDAVQQGVEVYIKRHGKIEAVIKKARAKKL